MDKNETYDEELKKFKKEIVQKPKEEKPVKATRKQFVFKPKG